MMAATCSSAFSLGGAAKPQRPPQVPLAPAPFSRGAAARGATPGAFSLFAGEPAPQGPFSAWSAPAQPQGPFSAWSAPAQAQGAFSTWPAPDREPRAGALSAFVRPDLPPVGGEERGAARARGAAPSAGVHDQSFSGKLSSNGKQRFRSALEQVSYMTNCSAQERE